jgi:TatD DNase family protein
MPLFDTHAHLDQEDFNADRTAVVERAVAAGVEHILCVGVTAESSAAAVRLAEEFPQVRAGVGIHPNSTAAATAGDWDRILKLLDHPRVAALGETGLDRYWNDAPFEIQQAYFLRHLRLSRERGLPVIIHCRDAADDLMPLLRTAAESGPLLGVLHAFSGDAAMALQCAALGLHLGFAGNVTYKNKKFEPLRAAAAAVPLDRLLVETDSPYLSPEPLRGKRNEPANVAHTASFLARLRGIPREEFDKQTTENARRLFGFL